MTSVTGMGGRGEQKGVFSTPFEMYGPSSVFVKQDHLVDLLTNKSVQVRGLEKSYGFTISNADANMLAIATEVGGLTVRSYDLAKGAYLPGSWLCPGAVNMIQYGHMTALTLGSNYLTNQTWKLETIIGTSAHFIPIPVQQ